MCMITTRGPKPRKSNGNSFGASAGNVVLSEANPSPVIGHDPPWKFGVGVENMNEDRGTM